jgi:hypothetical protein
MFRRARIGGTQKDKRIAYPCKRLIDCSSDEHTRNHARNLVRWKNASRAPEETTEGLEAECKESPYVVVRDCLGVVNR